ncbi:MAG: FkbM family methyltransferase, partial [bacterium]
MKMELQSVKYNGLEIGFNNRKEFETLFDEIFLKQIYRFETKNPKPVIFDCGSHIGLSVLYFKMLYPGASIVAFEPDKKSFKILKKNIEHNKLDDIETYNLALSGTKGIINFYRESSPDWDTCGNSTVEEWGDRNGFYRESIESTVLSDYITGEIDFLKMDIEGAELNVLETIQNKIHLIRELALEYHVYNAESKNRL